MLNDRKIPELKFSGVVGDVLRQFKIYDETISVPETPKEKNHWRRGYICALLDTGRITRKEWDELCDGVNRPKEKK